MQKPAVLKAFRRAKWLRLSVFPFFLSSSLDMGYASEVIQKERIKTLNKQAAAKKQGMDEKFLLNPDAYLEQMKKGQERDREETAEKALDAASKAPDHGDLKRKFREEARQSRLRLVHDAEKQVREMQVRQKAGLSLDGDWKTLKHRLSALRAAKGRIQQELVEERKGLGDRGVGFWKRLRYGSQRKTLAKSLDELAKKQDALLEKKDLAALSRLLGADQAEKPTRLEHKPQFRDLPRDLSAPGRIKAKSDAGKRRADRGVDAATEPLRLAQAGGGTLAPPASAPTYGEAIDPSVLDFAREHGYDPYRIFKAVYDGFAYEPYYGVAKGARGTLLDRAGNDFDLSLLLRDALRASGYEAELEHGMVESDFSELRQFLGLPGEDKVSHVLATGGIPGNFIQDGSRKFARYEHAWVNAKVPYDSYRGRSGSAGERSWIDLDPSFKQHRLTPGIPVAGALRFDFDDYVSGFRAKSPREYFEDSLWAYLRRAGVACNTLAEVPLRSEILPFEGPYLPNGLKATKVSTLGVYRTVPDVLRKKAVISLQDGRGDAVLERTLSLEDALYRSVALTYAPASSRDQEIIDSYGGLRYTPPYLIKLLPELRLDGQVVQMGEPVPAGEKYTVLLTLSGQRLNQETERWPSVTGAEMALVLAQGGVSSGAMTHHLSTWSELERSNAPERAVTAQQRYVLGAKYYRSVGQSAEILAGYFGYRYVGGLHGGYSASKVVRNSLYGLSTGWSWQNTVFSAERFYLGMVPLQAGVTAASQDFNRLFGAQSSFLEHQTGEDVDGGDFVSTVKIFQLARQQGIALDTLTSANLDAKLPLFAFLDADAVADLRNAVALGKTPILPKQPITRHQWTGTGYTLLNPATGTGDYIISGRLSGGEGTGGEGEEGGGGGGECSPCGSRVYHNNGQYVSDYTELMVPALGIPAVFAFGYNNQRNEPSPMGFGWQHSFGQRLFPQAGGNVVFYDDEHLARNFRDSAGEFVHPPGFFATLEAIATGYRMRMKDNTTWTFAPSGQLLSIANLDAQSLTVDTTADGTAHRVRHSDGRTLLTFAYQGGALASVQDPGGREVAFDVEDGELVAFTNAAGESMSFTYFDDHNMASKTDGLGRTKFFLFDTKDRLMEYADPKGAVTQYLHDDAHRVFVEVDPAGQELSSYYDQRGFATLKVDGNGNRLASEYDADGNLVSWKDSRGFTYAAQYDGFGNKLYERNTDSTERFYAYDTLNLMVKDSNATEGLVTRYEFTSKGHLQQQDNADGTYESFLYDAEGQLLRKVGRGDDTTTFTYTPTGNVATATDAMGQTTTYLYDPLGRMGGFVNGAGDSTRIELDAKDRVLAMLDGEGFRTTIVYDAAGNRSALVNAQGDTTRFILDENNNVVETRLPGGPAIRQEYNELNQVIARIDALGRRTVYEYDKEHAGGRLKKVTDPLGQSLSQGYCGEETDPCDQVDKNGFVTRMERDGQYRLKSTIDALGNRVGYTYDSRGNKASMTDGEGRTTRYVYDTENRLIQVIGALNDTTEYVYNALGQRIFDINANGDTVSYAFDKAGRMTSERDLAGSETRYVYDAAGRMRFKVDAKGDTTKYVYTRKGQVKEIRYQDGMVETFKYDALGRKIEESNGPITYSYRYDKLGRMVEFQNHALAKSLKYEYDMVGNKTAQVNGEGERSTYRFDALNRLLEIKDVNGGVSKFEYDRMGNRTKLVYPNGVYTAYTYDSAYRLLEMGHFGKDNSLLGAFRYTYDKVGNRKSMVDSRGTHTYHYDAEYRLTGVEYPEGRSQAWSYDATGNRLWEVEALPSLAPDTTFYHYTKDRLDSTTGAVAESYRYDSNGSMTGRGSDVFRYDSKLRLRQAQAAGKPLNSMTYDPMGLRVQTVSSEGRIGFLIDPTSNQGQFNTMSVSAEYMNGAKSREFGLGTRPDEVLWEENGEGLFYLLYDGLGSVVAATNSNGQVVAQMAYDAFGKVFSQSGQAQDVRYGFTGRPMDKDIGLQYNRARIYDAGVGRWNRADEYRGELEEPASRHRYMYVFQNPVRAIDPSGFSIEDAAWNGWKALISSINLTYKMIAIGVAISLLSPDPISVVMGIKLLAFAFTIVAWVNSVFSWALKQNDISTADNIFAALINFTNTLLMMASLVALSGGVPLLRSIGWAVATTAISIGILVVSAEIYQAEPSAPLPPNTKGSCP